MKTSPAALRREQRRPTWWRTLLLAGAISFAPCAVAATGTVSGTISNAATGNLLEGARVEIRALGLGATTDLTGRFVIAEVPAGAHELAASYLGLDEQRYSVTVAAGARVTRDFDLTSGVYRMQAFTVAGEREGAAAAITAQRNSANLKNVAAMDSFGHLPNMAASEVALRLPGVAGGFSDEDNVIGFTIRGAGPGLNTITVDGALLSSQGGMTRQTRIHEFTGSMFDQVELTRGTGRTKGPIRWARPSISRAARRSPCARNAESRSARRCGRHPRSRSRFRCAISTIRIRCCKPPIRRSSVSAGNSATSAWQ
jgi:hypothetical protein